MIVTLHGLRVGTLRVMSSGFDFVAAPEAIREYGLNSSALSLAVPLLASAPARDRDRRRNFFAELLPEGDARTRLAQEARVDPADVIAMLREYGRDVAGAVQTWDPEAPGEPRAPRTEQLDERGVSAMLQDVRASPLGNRPRRGGKTSLAGVQSKIVLARDGDAWMRVLDGYPSTHILKPVVGKYPSMIFDEEYGSRFARHLGLARFETYLDVFAGTTALVIERYDRSESTPDGRVHQEDFNQILGTAGLQKYEVYGGRGLADVARALGEADTLSLLRLVTLSVAVGNLDLHLKNISLIHEGNHARLADAYDIVPQHFYTDMDGEVALYVDGVAEHRAIHSGNIVTEAVSWGIAEEMASVVVQETLTIVRQVAEAERPHAAAHPGLQDEIMRITDNLLNARTVSGDDPERGPQPMPHAQGAGAWQCPNGRAKGR
ncbi:MULTISPECIES: HipA domain-containing protein [unclassified Microbacterium]|uniref:type II toxin-antitoxin system HipA family toxin n=1 Tax=unclassified Microbacterium TaxID=2609290 RepID=UPI0025D59160|nr:MULTISPECIES: HipA domain-containing protein [unclassified Microbacterium]